MKTLSPQNEALKTTIQKYIEDPLPANFNEIIRLINAGANPNTRDNQGRTALYIAARNGHLKAIEYLIAKGADVNQAITDSGATPLFIAAQNGHLKVVEYLIAKGANVNKATNDGETPLFAAAREVRLKGVEYIKVAEYLKVVEYLVKKGKANVNQARTDGATPLFIAAVKGNFEVVEYLIKEGKADVNKAKTDGATTLHAAAQNGHLKVVEYLIKEGKADVNKAKTDDGTTPLLIAAQNGHLKVVEYLIAQGANIEAKTKDGKTALDIAKEKNHNEILAVLEAAQLDKAAKEQKKTETKEEQLERKLENLIQTQSSQEQTISDISQTTQEFEEFKANQQKELQKILAYQEEQKQQLFTQILTLGSQIAELEQTKSAQAQDQARIAAEIAQLTQQQFACEQQLESLTIKQEEDNALQEARLASLSAKISNLDNLLYLPNLSDEDKQKTDQQRKLISEDRHKQELYTQFKLMLSSILRGIQQADINKAGITNLTGKDLSQKIIALLDPTDLLPEQYAAYAPYIKITHIAIKALINHYKERTFIAKCSRLARMLGDGETDIKLLSEAIARRIVLDEELLAKAKLIEEEQNPSPNSNPSRIQKFLRFIKEKINEQRAGIEERMATTSLSAQDEIATIITSTLLGAIFDDEELGKSTRLKADSALVEKLYRALNIKLGIDQKEKLPQEVGQVLNVLSKITIDANDGNEQITSKILNQLPQNAEGLKIGEETLRNLARQLQNQNLLQGLSISQFYERLKNININLQNQLPELLERIASDTEIQKHIFDNSKQLTITDKSPVSAETIYLGTALLISISLLTEEQSQNLNPDLLHQALRQQLGIDLVATANTNTQNVGGGLVQQRVKAIENTPHMLLSKLTKQVRDLTQENQELKGRLADTEIRLATTESRLEILEETTSSKPKPIARTLSGSALNRGVTTQRDER